MTLSRKKTEVKLCLNKSKSMMVATINHQKPEQLLFVTKTLAGKQSMSHLHLLGSMKEKSKKTGLHIVESIVVLSVLKDMDSNVAKANVKNASIIALDHQRVYRHL